MEERLAASASKSDTLLTSIKTTENRMADLTLLMKHAATYRKLKKPDAKTQSR